MRIIYKICRVQMQKCLRSSNIVLKYCRTLGIMRLFIDPILTIIEVQLLASIKKQRKPDLLTFCISYHIGIFFYPFITPRGINLTTFVAIPKLCETFATISTSLYACGTSSTIPSRVSVRT